MPTYIGTNKIKGAYIGTQKVKSIYIGTDKVFSSGRLPSGYQEVEWIGFNNNTWIDIYYITLSTSVPMTIDLKFKMNTLPSMYMDGFVYSGQPLTHRYSKSGKTVTSMLISGNLTIDSISNIYRIVETDDGINGGTATLYINDVISTSTTGSYQKTIPTSNFPFSIGGFYGSSSHIVDFNLYHYIITYNNVISLDLVPCYRTNDNEIGMYDLVSNRFFTNVGTGTFTKGPDV